MSRFIAFHFLCSLALLVDSAHGEVPSAKMPEKHFGVFEKYCLDCHDAESEKGGVNLEDLSFTINSIESAELWQKVLNATNSGEMPPEKKVQLQADEKTEFLADLSNQLVIARDAFADTGGVITMRRLNRREYENTIESLLGVRIDAKDLPDDSNSGGFDTNGSALFFSSDQFEQYLKIGRRVLDKAIASGPAPTPQKVHLELEKSMTTKVEKLAAKHKKDWDRSQAWRNSGGKPPTDFGFIDAARVDFEEGQYQRNYGTFQKYLENPASKTGMPLYNFFRGCSGPQVTLPKLPGNNTYIIRAKIAVLNDEVPKHRRFIEFGSISHGSKAGEINVLGCRQITGTMENPQIVELEYTPVDSNERNFMIRERHINQAEAAKKFFMQDLAKTGFGPPPALWIDWIEWEGPLSGEWPPKSHQSIFIPKETEESAFKYNRRVIETFAKRAFRTKEPSKTFIDKLMAIYGQNVKTGINPREAIKEPLSIILASPGFLYLNEPAFGAKRRELNDRELAVRLSYFLWSSPPDSELLLLADENKLKEPGALSKQTKRMLADPRAEAFISGFAHQWLHMDRLDFFQFNYLKYPLFDDSVKEAARNEVYQTIKASILEQRPIGELLKDDQVMVNDLLAEYYGIEGVDGEHFRRVPVPQGLPRGGLLGMAAVMAMGSDGERSSPVERGSWILRCILNDAPPPAPANVPQLSRLGGQQLSARELQKAHQEEPQCAQCHRNIDPLGFGLENFDAVGLWRPAELVQSSVADQKKAKRKASAPKLIPIDASGTLPDGTKFADFFELRDRIAEKNEAFARGFTENLIEYALGRPFGFTDYNMADNIMKRAVAKNYAINEYIIGVVESRRFKLK